MTAYPYPYPYPPSPPPRPARWPWVVGLVLLIAISMTAGAAMLFHVAAQRSAADTPPPGPDYASIRKVAHDSTETLLSYRPDTVRQRMAEAADLLTGEFRDSYTQLANDVVIPGAESKHITAEATVAGVGIISAQVSEASALVYVDQSVTVGTDPPTTTASSVRLHLVEQDGRWLIDQFEPV